MDRINSMLKKLVGEKEAACVWAQRLRAFLDNTPVMVIGHYEYRSNWSDVRVRKKSRPAC